MYVFLQGKVSLVSQSGVHQRRIFIFVLAAFHVIYSVVIIDLAKAKMKRWKSWELETTSLEYQFTNDPSRFRFTRKTSFVKRHTGLSATPGLRWIVAFFRQFFASITKVDYLTLRHGFINTKNKLQAHFAPNSKFNFHKYIKRSMEDDLKVVVGISIPLWICFIIFQLLNVYGWYTFTWSPFVPLAVILIVGAKLEIIIMEMAREIQDKTAVVKGVPVVEPSNKYFWFNRPDIILFFIHFTLFQYKFGLKSCYHDNLLEMLARVVLAIILQFLCSYVTFPLYALVTQMGSHMKKAIFEEQTSKAIKKWQKSAKERSRLKNKAVADGSSNGFSVMSADHQSGALSRGTSPLHLLHKFKHNSTDIEGGLSTCTSPRSCYSETELSEIEGAAPSSDDYELRRQNNPKRLEESRSADFSFAMP
ncbi:protein MLO-like [Populus alba x Populus x berolinensis]|uniref:MLO-like protein n=1 Tax=Populus alba x Populus x berolinensis TaxID=444605 RepID=A0AAD6QHS7_9ROSI|nr:protein MLO-like [Populus alba x Populus x berolinensis]